MILSKHIYNPNSWTMHCKEMGFDTYRLRMDLDTPIEQVQQKAFDLVKDLDFSLAIEKLQNLEVGSWTKERALKAVDDYKKYLDIN